MLVVFTERAGPLLSLKFTACPGKDSAQPHIGTKTLPADPFHPEPAAKIDHAFASTRTNRSPGNQRGQVADHLIGPPLIKEAPDQAPTRFHKHTLDRMLGCQLPEHAFNSLPLENKSPVSVGITQDL